RTSGPIRTEAARLHQHHLDAQRFHLFAQCFGQSFDRKFCRVVVADGRKSNKTADGRHIHDAPLAMLAHSGQSRVNHAAQPKHVDLKHLAYLILFALFNGCEIADACIVDQHVDATDFFHFGSGFTTAAIAAQAIAGVTKIPGSSCIYTLGGGNIAQALSITGTSSIKTTGCGVYVNSSNSTNALYLSGTA